jgi:hypothetical protein
MSGALGSATGAELGADSLEGLAGEVARVDLETAAGVAVPSAPDAVAGAPANDALTLDDAEREAAALIGMLAAGVESLWPVLSFKPETRATGAKKLAPLLVKYNLGGTLFARWDAEISAGLFFGGVVYASYKAVNAEPEGAQGGGDAGK